jgi:hypothetical protein
MSISFWLRKLEILAEAENFMDIDSCDAGIANSYPA